MRPLRRDRRHILRDLPVLRIQAGRAQADRHGRTRKETRLKMIICWLREVNFRNIDFTGHEFGKKRIA